MPVSDHAQQHRHGGTNDREDATIDLGIGAPDAGPQIPAERKRESDGERDEENRRESRLFNRIHPEVLFSDFAPMVMVTPTVWEFAGAADRDERGPHPILRLLRLAVRPIGWVGGLILDWMTRDRERRHLHGLSDRMLKDIGLSRADLEREAGKRFWRR
jgi:uncharacterized protein YjiS (DUF1127 family)